MICFGRRRHCAQTGFIDISETTVSESSSIQSLFCDESIYITTVFFIIPFTEPIIIYIIQVYFLSKPGEPKPKHKKAKMLEYKGFP